MSVNFNGGLPKSVQGYGGVNPNANLTNVNNEDAVVNGGELSVNPDSIGGETTILKTKIVIWDKNGPRLQGDYPDGTEDDILVSFGDKVVPINSLPMSMQDRIYKMLDK